MASAHRSPATGRHLRVHGSRDRGIRVIIAGAGHAAHLAGVLAAHTSLPVIGVPIDSSCLQGMDALLATVQMPPGIPVATMAIGKSGCPQCRHLRGPDHGGVTDPAMAEQLAAFKQEMADKVAEKAAKMRSLTTSDVKTSSKSIRSSPSRR